MLKVVSPNTFRDSRRTINTKNFLCVCSLKAKTCSSKNNFLFGNVFFGLLIYRVEKQ